MSNSECYYVQALYDFETQESNEITFKLGDILQVIKFFILSIYK